MNPMAPTGAATVMHIVAPPQGTRPFWPGIRIAFAVAFGCVATASAVDVGGRAPPFDLPVLESATRIHSEQLNGKVVFVDFWASWCGPCRQSLPLYEILNKQFAQDGFVILAINLDENIADAKRFLKQHPITYTVLRDGDGEVPKAFGVKVMPSSFLIGTNGAIRAKHIGFAPQDIPELQAEIIAALKDSNHAH